MEFGGFHAVSLNFVLINLIVFDVVCLFIYYQDFHNFHRRLKITQSILTIPTGGYESHKGFSNSHGRWWITQKEFYTKGNMKAADIEGKIICS